MRSTRGRLTTLTRQSRLWPPIPESISPDLNMQSAEYRRMALTYPSFSGVAPEEPFEFEHSGRKLRHNTGEIMTNL